MPGARLRAAAARLRFCRQGPLPGNEKSVLDVAIFVTGFLQLAIAQGPRDLHAGILVASISAMAFYTSWMLQGDMQRELGEQQFATTARGGKGKSMTS